MDSCGESTLAVARFDAIAQAIDGDPGVAERLGGVQNSRELLKFRAEDWAELAGERESQLLKKALGRVRSRTGRGQMIA